MSDRKAVRMILCVFLGLFGAHKFYDKKIGLGVLYLFTCGLCGIGWIIDCISLFVDFAKTPPANSAAPVASSTPMYQSSPVPPPPKPLADGEKDFDLFGVYQNGYFLRYSYEKEIEITNPDAFEIVKGNGGKEIGFDIEEVEDDEQSDVAIYLNGEKIGYIQVSQTLDMVHSWTRREMPFLAYINRFSKSENKITYKIGFYYPLEKLDCKRIKLAGVGKRAADGTLRRENLDFIQKGEYFTVEKELFEEKYTAYLYGYSEIGDIPKGAIKYMNENGYNKMIGLIDEIVEGEELDSIPTAFANLYFY